ncbi:transcriptional regulator EpsA [Oxalobacteraceae bacterium GrIS 2.11]
MEDLVILNIREQEYLLRSIESALQVRRRRQFFLWSQGQVQGLLPHEIMVCVQFGMSDEVLHVECLHSVVLDPAELEYLCNPHDGLVIRLANHCRVEESLPCPILPKQDASHPMSRLRVEMDGKKLGGVLVHGTEQLPGGASFFAILGLQEAPSSRHTFFLELLLPYLHMLLHRVVINSEGNNSIVNHNVSRPVTMREIDVLRWVKEGKSNYEIGLILGISGLTVKNHLQKIYKKLNVQNRAQAVSRIISLRLLENSAQ